MARVLCDQAPVAALERAAGVAEGTTARIALAPEADLTLLLGAVTPQQWVEDITAAFAEQRVLDAVAARPLAAALADHVVSSARVGVAKPDPRIHAFAAEPDECPRSR